MSDADRPRLYLVTSVPGPMWDRSRERRDQDGCDTHATYMNALEASDDVMLGRVRRSSTPGAALHRRRSALEQPRDSNSR